MMCPKDILSDCFGDMFEAESGTSDLACQKAEEPCLTRGGGFNESGQKRILWGAQHISLVINYIYLLILTLPLINFLSVGLYSFNFCP